MVRGNFLCIVLRSNPAMNINCCMQSKESIYIMVEQTKKDLDSVQKLHVHNWCVRVPPFIQTEAIIVHCWNGFVWIDSRELLISQGFTCRTEKRHKNGLIISAWCDAYNPAAQYLSTVPTFMQADVDLLVGDLVRSSE